MPTEDTPKFSGPHQRFGKPFGTLHPFMICSAFGLLALVVAALVYVMVV